MYQTYEAPPLGGDHALRVRRLRQLMAALGVDAILVPRADEHQGEYVAPAAERLAWLTGFTGSAGLAAVARAAAALFVDGRYVVQAPTQVDTGLFQILQVPQAKLSDWLIGTLKGAGSVGYDPWLHAQAGLEDLGAALDSQGHKAEGAGAEPDRPDLGARAAGAADGPGAAAGLGLRRQARAREACPAAGHPAPGQGRRGDPDATRFDCLAL